MPMNARREKDIRYIISLKTMMKTTKYTENHSAHTFSLCICVVLNYYFLDQKKEEENKFRELVIAVFFTEKGNKKTT